MADDLWKLIDLELLVLWRVGIIESPLLKRHIFAEQEK
jgi:hypothetical protein